MIKKLICWIFKHDWEQVINTISGRLTWKCRRCRKEWRDELWGKD